MHNKSRHGFTLIEVIAVLVILGIVGVFGTLFLVNMVRSYKWAEDNAHLAQKAQVALTRIAVELTETDETIISTSASLSYGGRTIGRHAGEPYLRLATDDAALADGDYLVDRVTNFTVTKPHAHLFAIELVLTSSNGVPQTFETSIATAKP